MPRRLTTMRALTAYIVVILGSFISVGSWYYALDDGESVSVDVGRNVLLIVSATFALLLSPFLVVDCVGDRKREAERRALRRESDG